MRGTSCEREQGVRVKVVFARVPSRGGLETLLQQGDGKAKEPCAYFPLSESESVGVHGRPLARATSDIAVTLFRHGLSGLLLEFVRVRRDGRIDVVEHALPVDGVLVLPVLARIGARVLDGGHVGHFGLSRRTGPGYGEQDSM